MSFLEKRDDTFENVYAKQLSCSVELCDDEMGKKNKTN